MAVDLFEDFESGSNGADLTTGNTAFDAIYGTAPKFSTAQAVAGSKSMRVVTSSASQSAVGRDFTATNTRYVDIYIYFTSMPGANTFLAQFAVGATTGKPECRIQSSGKLQLRDNNVAVWTSTTVFGTGQWYRLSYGISASGQRMRIFYGANLFGSTPDEDSGWQTYGTGNVSRLLIGSATGVASLDFFMDAVTIETATWPSPPVTPPTVDAGSDQTIQDTHTATIDATVSGTNGTPSYAWSVLSGPSTASGQLSTTSAVDTTFTPTGGPGTYTLQLAVTDDSGTTSDTTTVTVTALQASDGVAAVLTSSGWTASAGTVSDCLTDDDAGTYVTSSDNPTSLDLKYRMRGILAPAGDYKHTLVGLGRSGGSGTVDVSLYRANGSTLVKKISGVIAPTTPADTGVTFAAADITAATTGDWNAGVVILVEATAS